MQGFTKALGAGPTGTHSLQLKFQRRQIHSVLSSSSWLPWKRELVLNANLISGGDIESPLMLLGSHENTTLNVDACSVRRTPVVSQEHAGVGRSSGKS